jgi:hypothetical protein
VDVWEAGSKRQIVVELRGQPIRIEATECDWVCVNPGRTSFCRTLYRGKWLGKLNQAVREKAILDIDSYIIVSDLRALAEIGVLKYEELLGFVESLDGHVGQRTTTEAMAAFRDIWGLLPGNAAIERWGMKFHQRLLKVVGTTSTPGEPTSHLTLRVTILGVLARLGDDGAKQCLLSLFEEFVQTQVLHPEWMQTVFDAGARWRPGGPAILKNFALTTADSTHRRRAIAALGAAPPDYFAELATDWCLNRSTDEIGALLSGVTRRVENMRFLWEFGRKNVDALIDNYGTVAFFLPGFFETLVGGVKGEEEVSEAERFAEAHRESIFYRPLLRGIENRKRQLEATSRAFDFQVLWEYVNRNEQS